MPRPIAHRVLMSASHSAAGPLMLSTLLHICSPSVINAFGTVFDISGRLAGFILAFNLFGSAARLAFQAAQLQAVM